MGNTIYGSANQVWVQKGRVGMIQFGYIEEPGKRNQWGIVDDIGRCFSATQNNCAAAFSDARRANEKLNQGEN